MSIDVPSDVLIWAVPILILGFIIGTGFLRKFSRSFWFFAFGFMAGLISMVMLEITFSAETSLIMATVAANRFIGGLFGRSIDTFTFSTKSPECIFGLVIIALIIIASVVDWNPKKKV
jgi:hypothetical protein